MSSSTSSAPGATRPRSQPAVSSTGSRWARASSTTGKNATAKSTSTMPGCHATTGLPKRRKRKIIAFAYDHPLEGYRPLTFMMLDADVAAGSRTSVWRVLHQAGILDSVYGNTSSKGTGLYQSVKLLQHRNVEVSTSLNTAHLSFCNNIN